MKKSLFESIRDDFVDRVAGIFMLGLGCLFLYIPIISLVDIHSKTNVMTDSRKADLDSITQNLDPSAMSEAVSRLMTREDIARVRVLKGEFQYPDFDIHRGKNGQRGEIGSSVETEAEGYRIRISYSMTDALSARQHLEAKGIIMGLGSFCLGVGLFAFGLLQIIMPAGKRGRVEEELRPAPLVPPTPEPPAPEPVRYEGLKIVKGGR